MPQTILKNLLHLLRRTGATYAGADISDGTLLERFLAGRDEAAFAALLERHGPMVMGVCQRVLGDAQAEDAFQATFFVLAQRANSIRNQDSLASWLFGVARRIASKARAQTAARRARERRVVTMKDTGPLDDLTWQELRSILDEEIDRLPEKLRAAVVLCHLEGKSYEQAAQEIGCPKSTLASRVTKAHELLRGQLTRRGVALSAGALTTALAEKATAAPVAALSAINIVKAATSVAAGETLAAGILSSQAIALAEEAIKAMIGIKAKLALLLLALCLTVGAGYAGYGAWVGQTPPPRAEEKQPPVVQGEPAENGAPGPAVDLHGDPLPAGAVARLGMDRWRHDSCIFAAFLPDGKRVVTVSPDRTIRVWEFPSGKEIKRITPPEPDGADFRAQVALSKDGKTIALGGTEIYLCDLATGKESARLKWEATKSPFTNKPIVRRVDSLAFSPDGEHLASITGVDIRIWDWAKAKEVRSFAGDVPGDYHLISQLVYAPGGKSIATRASVINKKGFGKGPPRDVVKLWDLATGKEIWTLRTGSGLGPNNSVGFNSVAFSPDGKTLAFTGSLDIAIMSNLNKPITLVEAATGKEIGTLAKDKEVRRLSSLVFAKDGTKLYAGANLHSQESGVMEWDIASGKLLRQCATPYAKGISLSPDGNTLGVAGSLEFLDLAGGKDITVRTGAATALYSLQFTPDGKNLFTTRGVRLAGESVQKWDAVTGKDLGPVSLPLPLAGIALSPNGKVLAGRQFHAADPFGRKGAFKFVLLDAASGKELGQFPPPGAAAGKLLGMNISFSPDGTILAIHSRFFPAKDCKIELYDVPAAKPRHTLDIQSYIGAPMVFSPDSKTFASYADADAQTMTLGLWDTTTGRRIGSLSLPPSLAGSSNYVDRGAFTPDGRCLALVMPDGTVALFELATGQLRNTFGKKLPLTSRGAFPFDPSSILAFSPDGKSFVGAGEDGTVYLWDIATGKELAAFKGHSGAVNAVAFARDGKTVASASSDGTALIWDVTKIQRPAVAVKALQPGDLETCWQALADTDAAKAWAAMGDFVAAPKQSVALIKERLKPAPHGELPDKRTSLLLQGERLRAYRAVEVLERIGSPDARKLLQTLAAGAPGALLTTSAQAALKR